MRDPNGSGKSTITNFFEVVGTYTNADDIVKATGMSNMGGHDVEPKTIIDRYHKSIDNIKKMMEICDILHVYDNTEEPIRIIRKHKEDISVFPNKYWTEEQLIEMIGG